MNWAGYTLIALQIMGLGLHLGKHGEPKNDKYSFGGALVNTIIMLFLLYKAGVLG